jgi:hypothetical protein
LNKITVLQDQLVLHYLLKCSNDLYLHPVALKQLGQVVNKKFKIVTKFVWLKVVPLKVSIFAWRLLRNRVPTRDNLLQRRIIAGTDQECTTTCGMN